MCEKIVRYAGALGLLIGGFALMSAPLHAQGGETAAVSKHRADCRIAAQVLQTGQPQTKREWAIGYIANCSDEGPTVLAQQWQQSDDSNLEALIRASGRIRDARLYIQLWQTATDRSQRPQVRIGAMLVLARYVDPGSAVWLSDLVPPDSIRRIPLIGASTTAVGQLSGSQPIEAPVGPTVLALLESVAAARAEEPREVWYAAAVLARRVQADINLGRAY